MKRNMRRAARAFLCLLTAGLPILIFGQTSASVQQVQNQIASAIQNLGANPPPPGSATAGGDCMPSQGISLLGVEMESPNIPRDSIARLRPGSPLRERINALDAQIAQPTNQQISLQRDSDTYASRIQRYGDDVNRLMWGLSKIPSTAKEDESYSFNEGPWKFFGSRRQLNEHLKQAMQELSQAQQALTQTQAGLSRVSQQLDRLRVARALAYSSAVEAARRCQ